jgi:hypothetical protein
MEFHVEAGKRAEADLPIVESSSAQPEAVTFPASAPIPRDRPSFDLAAQGPDAGEQTPPVVKDSSRRPGLVDLYYTPCPQGDDCAGDGKHNRIFDCEQGCGFQGCASCMEAHDREPHVSDSDTMREMVRSIGRLG